MPGVCALGINELFTKRLALPRPYSCVFAPPEHGGDQFYHTGLALLTQAKVLETDMDFMVFAECQGWPGWLGWWVGLIIRWIEGALENQNRNRPDPARRPGPKLSYTFRSLCSAQS